MTQISTQPVIDFDKRVGQYVQLRTKIKQIKDKQAEELKPYNEALEALNNLLLAHLISTNTDSASSSSGTVYKSAKETASISDAAAFWTYVVTQANFDLLDKRANLTAVKDHIEQHKQPPPGVNFNSRAVVGVRRK